MLQSLDEGGEEAEVHNPSATRPVTAEPNQRAETAKSAREAQSARSAKTAKSARSAYSARSAGHPQSARSQHSVTFDDVQVLDEPRGEDGRIWIA